MNTVGLHAPRRRGDVEVIEHDDRSLLLTPGRDTAQVLNPTARALWDLCDGATTPEEMADAVCDVFDVDPRTAVADVRNALARFADAGLLEVERS